MKNLDGQAGEGSRARSSWLQVSEGLIGGIQHTLNNRMAALSAVSQVLEADLPTGHPLAGAMGKELLRLERTVSLLSLLVSDEGAEPVQLQMALEEVRQLFEMHHALRDLRLAMDLPPDLYPLWIQPSSLRRALMVLLAVAGAQARLGGGVVEVSGIGGAETVSLTIRSSAVDRADVEMEAGLEGVTVEGAAELLERWGGTVEVEQSADGMTIGVSLLTLPEARRREASGSS